MIQDYPSLRGPCIKSLSKVHAELYTVFSKVKCLTTSSYLVELVSQLKNDGLIHLIFSQNPELCEKFPNDCYANDPPCLNFLQMTKFDLSIFKFKSFSLGNSIHSGGSYCQLTSSFVICLLDYNDFAAPVQFDLPNITNMERIGAQVSFNLVRSAKKALINIDFPANANIKLSFSSESLSSKFMSTYNQISKDADIVCTPQRKISVVQNFIALSGGYGDIEYDEEEDIEDMSQQDVTIERDQLQSDHTQILNSGQIEETESLLGTPLNTTKDTSVSKKFGRAVSVIVAESNEKISKSPKAQLQTPLQQNFGLKDFINDRSDNFEQVPDSLDKAFENFYNPPVDRGPSDVIIESIPEKIEQPQPKKEPPQKNNDDIWDFESDPDLTLNAPQATSTVNKRYRSKAMKCLTTQINSVGKKPKERKSNENKIKTKFKSRVHTKLQNYKNDVTEKEIPSSLDSSHQNAGSFLPLTSPMVGAHERARTRGFSKASGINVENDAKQVDIPEPKIQPKFKSKPGPKRKKRTIGEDFESGYVESQPVKKPRQSRASLKETAKPTARVTRGKKRAANIEMEPQLKDKSVDLKPKVARAAKDEAVIPAKLESPKESVELKTLESKARAVNSKDPATKESSKAKKSTTKEEISYKSITVTNKRPEPSASIATLEKNQAVLESTRLIDSKEKEKEKVHPKPPTLGPEHHLSMMSSAAFSAPLAADTILSEAYTNTLQRQIFESITTFSNQLVKKIHIINDEINKKVMTDLTSKYEVLFNDLRDSFQSDVDEMCGFITDVKSLLNLPEQELINYIKQKKFGTIACTKS